MGKKKDLTESESDTETDTDTESTNNKVNRKNNTILKKINNLSRKAKLYIGICVVLLLAGLYMWYKNKKNNIESNNELMPSQVTNNIQLPTQTGGQEIIQTSQIQQIQPILSHLTPNPLED
jgi:hypothetical protein